MLVLGRMRVRMLHRLRLHSGGAERRNRHVPGGEVQDKLQGAERRHVRHVHVVPSHAPRLVSTAAGDHQPGLGLRLRLLLLEPASGDW